MRREASILIPWTNLRITTEERKKAAPPPSGREVPLRRREDANVVSEEAQGEVAAPAKNSPNDPALVAVIGVRLNELAQADAAEAGLAE